MTEGEESKLADNSASETASNKSQGERAAQPVRSSMDFSYREPSISPCLILDVDNGVDFTFKGMGLRGNR